MPEAVPEADSNPIYVYIYKAFNVFFIIIFLKVIFYMNKKNICFEPEGQKVPVPLWCHHFPSLLVPLRKAIVSVSCASIQRRHIQRWCGELRASEERSEKNRRRYLGVEPKIWENPPNHPFLIGFSMKFTIHFGGFPPIFGNIHMLPSFMNFLSSSWVVLRRV